MKKLKEIIKNYSQRVFYDGGKYSQFTIDAIEQLDESVNDEENEINEGEGLGSINDLIGSCCYQIDTFIEVLKEGEDKVLFEELVAELRELESLNEGKKIEFKTLPKKDQ